MDTKYLMAGVIVSALAATSVVMVLLYSVSWREETLPVGVFEGSLTIEGTTQIPLMLFYPTAENGSSVEPDMTGAPYPAIVFSHGLGASPETYSWLCGYMVSSGYVTIAYSIPGFNLAESLQDSEEAIMRSIDYLVSDLPPLLKGMVDEDKIGVAGHSMGGMAVLMAKDERIRAVVSVAPYYSERFSWILDACQGISVPTQIICGSADFLCPASDGLTYYSVLSVTREFIVINGASHLSATDFGFTEEQMFHRNVTAKYMENWFAHFLYEDNRDNELFGAGAQADLNNGILVDLIYHS